jgi:hypothetical protein
MDSSILAGHPRDESVALARYFSVPALLQWSEVCVHMLCCRVASSEFQTFRVLLSQCSLLETSFDFEHA